MNHLTALKQLYHETLARIVKYKVIFSYCIGQFCYQLYALSIKDILTSLILKLIFL